MSAKKNAVEKVSAYRAVDGSLQKCPVRCIEIALTKTVEKDCNNHDGLSMLQAARLIKVRKQVIALLSQVDDLESAP